MSGIGSCRNLQNALSKISKEGNKLTIANFHFSIKKPTLLLLLAALMVGLFFRVVLITTKTSMTHDEGISYLVATVNQGAFQEMREGAYPYGQWASASEWKAFLVPSKRFAFRQIGSDLAALDIHPPLYFWLLHLWTLLVGVHLWTGPTLNLLIFAISTVSLFMLARRLLKNDEEAVIVSFIWAVSPALTDVTLVARQYELLGLCIILFVWAMCHYADSEQPFSWLKWALLTISVTAGALTHFHFAIVVAGVALIFLLKLVRSNVQRFLGGAMGLALGYLLFFALHPNFLSSFKQVALRQGLESQQYWTLIDFLRRIYATGFTFTRFFVYGAVLQVTVFCLFVSFSIWLIWLFLKNRSQLLTILKRTNLAGVEAAYLFFWMMGITVLLYLTLLSPINAMSPRHMIVVWPFLAFMPLFLLRFFADGKWWGRWAVVGLVFLSGSANLYASVQHSSTLVSQADNINVGDRIVADSVNDGILPRIIWQLPDETVLFAADQSYLIAHGDEWLPELTQSSGYVADLSYTNTELRQMQIIDLLAQASWTAIDADADFNPGILYQLHR